MKNLVLWLALGLCGILPAAEIVCEAGNFPGHLQGIAADPTGIYWSFVETIVKTDYAGKTLLTVTNPPHAGDLCAANGKLYVAINLYQKETAEKEGGRGWIYIYDTDLKLLEKKPLPDTPKPSCITFAQGKFYIAGNDFGKKLHPLNTVSVYSADFAFERKITVDIGRPTAHGAQTLNVVGDRILAGFYAKPGSWFFTIPDLKTQESFPAKTNVGLAVVPESLAGGRTLLLIAQSTGSYKTKDCGGKAQIMEWKDGKLLPAELKGTSKNSF